MSSSENTDSSPAEARLGYNSLNSQLSNLNNFGVGATAPASMSSMLQSSNTMQQSNTNGVGYLDYFDYDTNSNYGLQNNLNYAPAGGMNYASINGASNGFGAGNNLRQQLLRRRNGLMSQLGLGASQQAQQFGNQFGGQLNQYDNLGLGSSGYGATGSGYGAGPISIVSGYGPSQQCETGINPLLALLTLAGAAIGFYFIYIKLTMAGGRKFRGSYIEDVADMMWIGLEEFEDKVDKIANGQEDDSWIGQLYNQFSSSFGLDGSKVGQDELGSTDGLEPPILDETWGLEDIAKLHENEGENNEPRSRTKRSDDIDNNDLDEPDKDEEDDDIIKSLSGETKCTARFWKCLGGVAQGSLHYMNEPGGVSGAVQKMLFRVAFHGGFGNIWKAMMTIPEARKVKRCMNKRDDCMSFEVLRKEVQTLGADGEEFVSSEEQQRLLINPEFVESMDTSDGSQQFSPEDQAIEDAALEDE